MRTEIARAGGGSSTNLHDRLDRPLIARLKLICAMAGPDMNARKFTALRWPLINHFRRLSVDQCAKSCTDFLQKPETAMSVEPESGPGDSATSERTSGFQSTGPEIQSDSSDLHLQQPRPGACDQQPTPEVSRGSRQQEECVPPSLIASHVKFAVVRASFCDVNFCFYMNI